MHLFYAMGAPEEKKVEIPNDVAADFGCMIDMFALFFSWPLLYLFVVSPSHSGYQDFFVLSSNFFSPRRHWNDTMKWVRWKKNSIRTGSVTVCLACLLPLHLSFTCLFFFALIACFLYIFPLPVSFALFFACLFPFVFFPLLYFACFFPFLCMFPLLYFCLPLSFCFFLCFTLLVSFLSFVCFLCFIFCLFLSFPLSVSFAFLFAFSSREKPFFPFLLHD